MKVRNQLVHGSQQVRAATGKELKVERVPHPLQTLLRRSNWERIERRALRRSSHIRDSTLAATGKELKGMVPSGLPVQAPVHVQQLGKN